VIQATHLVRVHEEEDEEDELGQQDDQQDDEELRTHDVHHFIDKTVKHTRHAQCFSFRKQMEACRIGKKIRKWLKEWKQNSMSMFVQVYLVTQSLEYTICAKVLQIGSLPNTTSRINYSI